MTKRKIPKRGDRLFLMKDGRIVKGCYDLGCWRSTLGTWCVVCADWFEPVEVKTREVA